MIKTTLNQPKSLHIHPHNWFIFFHQKNRATEMMLVADSTKNLMNNNLMSPKRKEKKKTRWVQICYKFSFHFHLFFLPFIFNLHICKHTISTHMYVCIYKETEKEREKNEWIFMKIWLRHEMSFEDQPYCRQIYSTSVRSWLLFSS